MSSFISCSLLCSSLVSWGVRSPVFVVTPLTWHSTAQWSCSLGVWSDMFEPLASSSPCLCATGRWEWAEGEESWFWGTMFTHWISVFYDLCLKTEMQSKDLLETEKNRNIGKKHVWKLLVGQTEAGQAGDGYKWLNVYGQFWLMQSAWPGSLGMGAAGQPAEVQLRCFENTVSVFP